MVHHLIKGDYLSFPLICSSTPTILTANEGRGVNYVKIEKHIFIFSKLCCTNDDNNWIDFYSTKHY